MSDDVIDSMDKLSMEAGKIVSNEWAMSMLPVPGGKEKEGDDGDVLGVSATNDNDDGGGGGASNRVITATHPDVKKYLKYAYPLHSACRDGASLDVIKYLVEEADGDKGKELLGKADNKGKHPLHWARTKGASPDVIKYLVEEADGIKGKELLDKADNIGMYPLHRACYGGASLDVIKYLVEEADGIKGKELLDKADHNGRCPLHCACQGGASLDVIKYLVEEADGDKGKELLGKANNDGWYPLHLARTKGASPDVIKYLIKMNPDPLQHKDDSGLLGSVADKSFLNDNMEANCQSTIWNETNKVVYVIVSDRTIETLKSTSLSTDTSPTIAGNTLASGSGGIADTKKDRGPTPPPQITSILPRESRTFNLESTYYYVTCYTKNASDRNVFHEVNKRVKGTDNYKIEPHCLENCLFVAELENLFGKEIFLLSLPAPVSNMDTTTPPTADDGGQGGSSQCGTDPPAADSSQRETNPGAPDGGGKRQGDNDDDTSGNNNNRGRGRRFVKVKKFWKKKATIRNKTDKAVHVIVSDRTIGEVKSTNLSAELPASLGKTGWSRTTHHNKGPTPGQMTTIPPHKSRTFNLESTYYYLTYYTTSENGNVMHFHGINLKWRGKDDYTIESTDVDVVHSLMTTIGLAISHNM